MPDNLVISPHVVSSNYRIQFTIPKPFVIASEAKQSRSLRDMTKVSKTIIDERSLQSQIPRSAGYSALTFKRPIRSSQKLIIFYSKLFFMEVTQGWVCRRCQVHFLARRYPKGAKNSKSAKRLKGKPQLNGFVHGSKRRFDLDSFRSGTAVNQAKILMQHQELPHLNPTTNKKIDQQKILIGFGGSRSMPKALRRGAEDHW